MEKDFMSTWTKQKLSQLCDVRDGTHDSPKPSSLGYPLVTSKHIINNKVDISSAYLINEIDYDSVNKRSKVDRYDILISMIGTVGEVAFINESPKFAIKNVGLIKTSNKILGRYLYYYLISPNGRNTLQSFLTGSTQKFISLSKLRDFPVTIPENETQKQIIYFLEAYDDLIENNEKRIRILEEMASRLYNESFVKFRFPGYERVRMVDSGTEYGKVPEGWEVVEMQSIAKIVDCLHTKKPKEIKTGNRILLQLNNILDNGMIDLTKKYLISDDDYKKWTKNIELREGDCVVTNVGRIAASAQIGSGVFAAAGRNMTVIRAEKIPYSFLIHYLHSRHMEREVSKKTDAGAIMGSLNVKNIYLLKVLLPEKPVLELFSKIVSAYRVQMNMLHKQNFNLSRTRDLLIPQLVTGRRELF
ncbi:MAG: restriction endonuclease subunit S [Ignavibacteria bacterium]